MFNRQKRTDMSTLKNSLLLTGWTFMILSCDSTPKTTPEIQFNGMHVASSGDTINRITEKGKQGLWRYKSADGSFLDTIYKDGVPQTAK